MGGQGSIHTLKTLWDGGSTLSIITFETAKILKLKGTKIKLELVKVGGQKEMVDSYRYKVFLRDVDRNLVPVEVVGLSEISSEISSICIEGLIKSFSNIYGSKIKRPSSGNIDLLVGYDYAAFHPIPVEAVEHLLILKNKFGYLIGGRHPSINKNTKKLIQDAHVMKVSARIEDFFSIESLGVECTPRCGGCKCGTCHVGGKQMTIQEEQEYQLIDSNMNYDPIAHRWIAGYPWVRDPQNLPDNRCFAMSRLISTEKRLLKDPNVASVYSREIKSMVHRGAARKLTEQEIQVYQGPKFYIAHHAVMKPDSSSTPCRIVFNSSAKYHGHCLNDYYAKGPDMLNNLLGILLRFREEHTAFVGDISKMFHTIQIPEVDQMTHRFLWINLEPYRIPDTYVMTAVNMGDKPSGSMAMVALKKTAEMKTIEYPISSSTILMNSYMDDIIDSIQTFEKAKSVTEEIDEILEIGGFRIKEWVISGSSIMTQQPSVFNGPKRNSEAGASQRVLGIQWDPERDLFKFRVSLPHEIPATFTKRVILSQINSIYDPLGLIAPFTVVAKILLRKLWAARDPPISWDDPLPPVYLREWEKFFSQLHCLQDLSFQRCLKPADAKGSPVLVVFSDGSGTAYGAASYVRWECEDGSFKSSLICSKNRLAPIKIVDIVRLELSGAVISKRVRSFVEKHMRYPFERIYHIVDSEIVKAMINKGSYGFNTFAANRIGEIQTGTHPAEWYWISGELNIADWLTRGKEARDLDHNSAWQNGPEFLKLPDSEWPIKNQTEITDLPETLSPVSLATVQIKETLATRIDIDKFSNFNRLIHVTARVLKLYERFKNETQISTPLSDIYPEDIKKAERFWVIEAQRSLHTQSKKKQLKKLCPKMENGIMVASGRAGRWLQETWNKDAFILLPSEHPLSKLVAEYEHRKAGHNGVAATIAQIRGTYWILGISKIAKRIVKSCVLCKIKRKRLESQIMGNLPLERLKPSPPFSATGIDYFGPFTIKGEVQKRTRGKCFGVIFTCLASRAVHIDVTPNYSTDGFLQVLRRFASIRGWPLKIHSDQGSQLVAASKELKAAVSGLDQDIIRQYGALNRCEWGFCPADAPWQNEATEILIKSAKRNLYTAIGAQVLSFSELQTVFAEVSQIRNQRPIGQHPESPEDGTYLCPNDLLLG